MTGLRNGFRTIRFNRSSALLWCMQTTHNKLASWHRALTPLTPPSYQETFYSGSVALNCRVSDQSIQRAWITTKRGEMSEAKADPLQSLVVDAQQISRDRLAELLRGKVLLDLQTATVHLVPEARTKMGARPAVLLALLGKKALSLLKSDAIDAMSPKDLADVTGVRGNTVRPILMRLADEGLVIRRGKGYAVHNAALHRVAGAINQQQD
jgi:hypothetical protein